MVDLPTGFKALDDAIESCETEGFDGLADSIKESKVLMEEMHDVLKVAQLELMPINANNENYKPNAVEVISKVLKSFKEWK